MILSWQSPILSKKQTTFAAWAKRSEIARFPRDGRSDKIGYTTNMSNHGFLRVASAVPRLRVADCAFNAEQIVAMLGRAEREGVALVVFPELCLTAYTCADLFQQQTLQKSALVALDYVASASLKTFSGLAIIGLPLA